MCKTGLLGFWQWAEAELNCLENLFARAIGSNYYLALAFQGMLHITVNQNEKLEMKTIWHENPAQLLSLLSQFDGAIPSEILLRFS